MSHLFFSRLNVTITAGYLKYFQVCPLYPKPGYVEMDPEEVWLSFVAVVKGAVQGEGVCVCVIQVNHFRRID